MHVIPRPDDQVEAILPDMDSVVVPGSRLHSGNAGLRVRAADLPALGE